jgi:hypothetical protein
MAAPLVRVFGIGNKQEMSQIKIINNYGRLSTKAWPDPYFQTEDFTELGERPEP